MSKKFKRGSTNRASSPTFPGQGAGNVFVISPALFQQMMMQQSPQKNASGQGMLPGAPMQPSTTILSPQGPRTWDYPTGWNISSSPSRQVLDQNIPTFEQLRSLARSCDYVQMCIRAWLDMAGKLELQIKPRPELISQGDDEDSQKYQKDIARYKSFFEKPDGRQDLHTWIRTAIVEQLEIDALSIYMRPTRGGGLYGMEIVDGSTIKPLLDDRGCPPTPPYPAYQQFLKGGIPGSLLTSEQLLYSREFPRTDSPYGISRVEMIIMKTNQVLRKQKKDLAKLTDGNVPAGFLAPPESEVQWSAEDLQAYQTMFDALLAGNAKMQARIKVVPPGSNYTATEQPDPELDFERFLLNVSVAAFGLSMSDLGFTEDVNRSSGDSQENMTYRRTMHPLIRMFSRLFTGVLVEYFNENRFKVSFAGYEEAEDLDTQSEAYSRAVSTGILSPSDAARLMNLPVSCEIPAFVMTADGPIFLEDLVDPVYRAARKQALLRGLQAVADPEKTSVDESNSSMNKEKRDDKGPQPSKKESTGAGTQPENGKPANNGETQVSSAGSAKTSKDQEERATNATTTGLSSSVNTGVMVAFYPSLEIAEQIALPSGEEASELHITVAYLGDLLDGSFDAQKTELLKSILSPFANSAPALHGKIAGIGRFTTQEPGALTPLYASVDVPGLEEIRTDLMKALRAAGIGDGSEHGYSPHITLAYLDPDEAMPLLTLPGLALELNVLTLVVGEERYLYPLKGIGMISRAAKEDYRRWRSRALEDVKAGRALRSFTSALIPEIEHYHISQALQRCQTPEEVRDVFRAASEGRLIHWQDIDKEIQGQITRLQEQGVTRLQWKSKKNACDVCQRNDTQVVQLGERFASGALLIPEHGNCECQVTELRGEQA